MRKLLVSMSILAVFGFGAFTLLNDSSSIASKAVGSKTVISCSDCAGWGSGGG